jgi:Glycosyl transferase family 2
MPFFSVVMATSNRPALFRQALESVLAQSCRDIEIIVVNHGSAGEHQPAFARPRRTHGSNPTNSVTAAAIRW